MIFCNREKIGSLGFLDMMLCGILGWGCAGLGSLVHPLRLGE